MISALLGKVAFDEQRLAKDLALLEQHPPAPEVYSEFRVGTFHTYNLRNPCSEVNDTRLNAGNKDAGSTSLGVQLTYLDELLNVLFEPSAIRMVRVMKIHAGMLFPNRDMVEFGEAGRKFTRVHVMLKTNPTALHSESSDVFRMEAGDRVSACKWDTCCDQSRSQPAIYDDGRFEQQVRSSLIVYATGVRPSTPTMKSRSELTYEEIDEKTGEPTKCT
ncbi:hypothetical protein HDG42_007523 [Paraburkholderia sp. JPY171]|nr:hypothetical protein [Paraburkholderia atlantica]